MNFKDLRARMPALLNSGISLELISSPGRGKSEFIADTVKIMSKSEGRQWGFATLFLATMTPPDLIGYLFKGERKWENGKITAVTEPTLPTWMISNEGRPLWDYPRGILFLDEFGQGESDVKRASAELLLNRQLGPWRLPDGWSVIAASNLLTDRSGVTKSLDFVINRRLEIPISDDIEAWTEWAMEKGIMPLTVAFANQNPQIVFAPGVPEKQGPWCTPRSLVMADKLLRTMSNGSANIPDDPAVKELVSGLIGAGSAAQYFAFVKLEREMPKFETIIKDPMKAKCPGADAPDAQMLICFNLAHRVTEEHVDPVVKYVERLPKEFAVTFAHAACRRNPDLVSTKTFQKWARENSSLMAAIAH